MSVCTEYNLRRHFKTTHANSDTTFLLGSDACRQKILGLISCYEQRCNTLFWAFTEQERATSALLQLARILDKKKKAVQECRVASVKEMVTDEKIQNSLTD